jgi:hypothetical protein
MERIFYDIIAIVVNCENNKDVFSLPILSDCQFTEKENPKNGSVKCSKSYKICKGKDRIEILYESKDKCSTFQINPDRSTISMRLFINRQETKMYSNSWDEKC